MFSCLYYLFSTKWYSSLWVIVKVMVFNATFNSILAISWRSVLLVEQTGVRGKQQWPVESHWQFFHIMWYRVELMITYFIIIIIMIIIIMIIIIYNYSLLLGSIQVFMDLKIDIHKKKHSYWPIQKTVIVVFH